MKACKVQASEIIKATYFTEMLVHFFVYFLDVNVNGHIFVSYLFACFMEFW